MNVSRIFIERPVATSVLFVCILFFGWLGFNRLPVNDLPNVDFPTITVTTRLPGASPEVMANSVAQPLEREFARIAGVDEMTSSSTSGNTRITLTFSLSRDIDSAAQDVQTAISQATRRLPGDMPEPPASITDVTFPMGKEGSVSVIAATDPKSPVARFIEKRGEGPYSICLRTDNLRASTS